MAISKEKSINCWTDDNYTERFEINEPQVMCVLKFVHGIAAATALSSSLTVFIKLVVLP